MKTRTTKRLTLLVLAGCLCAGPSLAGDCRSDSDVLWFLQERDREEATLLAAWVNGQISADKTVPVAAQIMAWETRLATTCTETRFVADNVHLLNLEGVTVESIPGRLFLAMLERNGLRGLASGHQPIRNEDHLGSQTEGSTPMMTNYDDHPLAGTAFSEMGSGEQGATEVSQDPRMPLARRVLISVVGVQAGVLAFLLVDGPARVSSAWLWAFGLVGGLHEVGGLATVPLVVCMLALGTAASLLTVNRFGLLNLSARTRTWADRALSYSGRIAWMLGLLQTLLSLYTVRQVFGAQMDYESMVSRLGDVSATAYGSSLLGGGTLLVGWIAQLLLKGKLED